MSATALLAIAKDVARNPYAWPGGYPKFLLMADGGCLCHDCVKSQYRHIASATSQAPQSWAKLEAAGFLLLPKSIGRIRI